MHIDTEKLHGPLVIRFDSATEADDVCELLKELLNAKRSCRGAIFCTRPPIKKAIDSME